MEPLVTFVCVKEGARVRVKIETPGYHPGANCQFPRNLREVGKKFVAPRSAVTFAEGSAGTVFYRVSKHHITPYESKPWSEEFIERVKVFEVDTETTICSICFSEDKSIVFIPCGHYCTCTDCAQRIQTSSGKCPICRCGVQKCISESQIN